jgi:hypothetical protein
VRNGHGSALVSTFNRIHYSRRERSGGGLRRTLLPAAGAKDASVNFPVDGVTSAGGALEPSHIDNGHIATAISDQLPALQGGCGARHAHSANAQHQCEKFVRDVELV